MHSRRTTPLPTTRTPSAKPHSFPENPPSTHRRRTSSLPRQQLPHSRNPLAERGSLAHLHASVRGDRSASRAPWCWSRGCRAVRPHIRPLLLEFVPHHPRSTRTRTAPAVARTSRVESRLQGTRWAKPRAQREVPRDRRSAHELHDSVSRASARSPARPAVPPANHHDRAGAGLNGVQSHRVPGAEVARRKGGPSRRSTIRCGSLERTSVAAPRRGSRGTRRTLHFPAPRKVR